MDLAIRSITVSFTIVGVKGTLSSDLYGISGANPNLLEDSNETLRFQNSTNSVDNQDLNPIPAYVIAAAVVSFAVMTTALMYCLCVWARRRRRRKNQLAALTPGPDPRLAGVRACQPVQFVVPATVVVSETDSVSDGSSGNTLPILTDRRRRYGHINPQDLQRGLYVGVKAASEKGTFLGDLGEVGFSLSFNPTRCILTVQLIGARNLPCHFLKTTANPCAKVVLLPDRTTKYMSRVQRNTTNPHFNEKFTFSVRRDDLLDKRVRLSLWDYDRFSRRCLLGQITYPVRDAGLSPDHLDTGEIWVHLKPDSAAQSSGIGEVLFSLCYNPDSANLRLTVLKARALPLTHDKGKDLSVYVKVTLYVRRKLVRTKKTPARRKTTDVEFDSSFDVHVPQGALGEVDFLVALCEKGPGLGSTRKMLGRTQVGTNCLCDQGLQHWQDMLLSPKSTCAQWHILCG